MLSFCQDVDKDISTILNGENRIWRQGGDHGDIWEFGEVDVFSNKEWRYEYKGVLIISCMKRHSWFT